MEPDTSAKAALAMQPKQLKDFITNINNQLREGHKLNYKEVWEEYKVAADNRPIFENAIDALSIVIRNQKGTIFVWDNQDKLAITLEARPALPLLKQVASTIKGELSNGSDNYQFAYSAFIRSLHTLGAGTYGVVISGRLSTFNTDQYILNTLLSIYKTVEGEIDVEDIENLISILDQFPQYVIKSSSDEESVAQEVLVGKQMNEVISKIHIFAYYYAISICRGDLGEIELDNAYLYPCHVDLNAEEKLSFVYSEYIPGKSLYIMLSTITYPQLLVTLAVIHSSSAYLWKKYRFVHGDLYNSNIMLRFDPSGDPYDIPILDEDGNVKYYVRLPWHPVMIDLGMATTEKYSSWTSLGNPYTTTLNDIIRLYDSMLYAYPDLDEREPFSYYLDKFNTVFTREEIDPNVFPTPLQMNIHGLTHSALLNIIEDIPEYEMFIVDKPEYNDVIDYNPIDRESTQQAIREEHKARRSLLPKLNKLSKLTEEHNDEENGFNEIVKNYISVMTYSALHV